MNLWYILLIVPALATWWAQARVRRVYEKYGGEATTRRVTGLEVTRRLLAHQGLEGITIERAEGHLTDHYDPDNATVHLTDSVANTASIKAMGIAAHEVAHIV